jgi:hypothetical protein
MVMIGSAMIVIVATVTITVIVAVVAIRIIGAMAIISMAICTPMMSAVDASNAPGC